MRSSAPTLTSERVLVSRRGPALPSLLLLAAKASVSRACTFTTAARPLRQRECRLRRRPLAARERSSCSSCLWSTSVCGSTAVPTPGNRADTAGSVGPSYGRGCGVWFERPRAIRAPVSRPRLIAAGALLVVAIAAVVIALTSSAKTVNPFAYTASKQPEFESRAAAGESYLLYTLSPGGALATAGRVAALRGPVESAATAGHGDPALVEAIVFLESGGRSDAIAGGDPANAA